MKQPVIDMPRGRTQVGMHALWGLLALGAFVGGVVFQKRVTVGYTLKWAKSFLTPASNAAEFRPVGEFYSAADLPGEVELRLVHSPTRTQSRLDSELKRWQAALIEEDRFVAESGTRQRLAEWLTKAEAKRPAEEQLRLGRYYRPELMASLLSPPSEMERRGIVEAISAFAARLKSEGRHLIFLPLPNPVDIDMPLYLGQSEGPSIAPADTRLFVDLVEAGVDVLDLRPDFAAANQQGCSPFHRLDHHWSPAGLEIAAQKIADLVRQEWSGWPATDPVHPIATRWVGVPDVACNAAYGPPDFRVGDVMARSVFLRDQRLRQSLLAPVLVLGDSNVVHLADYAGHACDFTSHLAFHLQRPLAFFGQMGGTQHIPQVYEDMQGRTGVKPAVVVWVAMNGGWKDIRPARLDRPEPAQTAEGERLRGSFKVVAVSRIPAVADAPYPDALYTFQVRPSDLDDDSRDALVVTWAFRDRQETAQRRVNVGKTLDLELAEWEETCKTQPNLRRLQRVDTLNEFALPMFFWDQPN